MSRYHYAIDAEFDGVWKVILTDGLEFSRGYLLAHREMAPRLAMRLRRTSEPVKMVYDKVQDNPSDKILDSLPALDAPTMVVAGWPTGAQLIRGAVKLLRKCREHRDYVTPEQAGVARAALAALEQGEGPSPGVLVRPEDVRRAGG
jgi:hypothetical protein